MKKPAHRTSKITDHTGYWMRMVSNAVSQEFSRKVAQHDVSVAEWAFMRTLFRPEPMAPSAIAKEMGMTKGAISKLAERLLAKGLLARKENLEDGRAHALLLTARGRAKVPAPATLADDNDAEFFGLLTKQEHRDLSRILKRLAQRRGIDTIPVD